MHTAEMMSSEPIVGYKRSATDATDTSNDDGSPPERGKEAEAASPKLDQAERERNKKLRGGMTKLTTCRERSPR